MAAVRQDPWWSPPHLLTLSRLPTAVAAWVMRDDPAWFLGLVAFGLFTDLVDGPLARRMAKARQARGEDPGGLGAPGGHGAWLDPLCDKTLVLTAVAAVIEVHRPPWTWVLGVALREVVLAGVAVVGVARLGLRWEGYDFRAGLWGKATLVCQGLAVLTLAAGSAATWPLAALSAGLGAVAGGVYAQRMWRHGRDGTPQAPGS